MLNDPSRFSQEESVAYFRKLFPQGLAGEDVMQALAPQGWEKSSWVAVFHPSPEVQSEEAERIRQNMQSLFGKKSGEGDLSDDENKAGEFQKGAEELSAEDEPQPIESEQAIVPEKELRELFGRCLWDIFADNHDVIADDGRLVYLGSFRAAGGFLADLANEEIGAPKFDEMAFMKQMIEDAQSLPADPMEQVKRMIEQRENKVGYDYMDFYLGTSGIRARADLSPVYEFIFERLRQHDADWKYSFPRLSLVDLRPLKEQLDANNPDAAPEWESYDPAASFAQEQEQMEKDAEIAETREKLDQAHREAVEEARDGPPPKTVACYQKVYGELPEGWPPSVDD